MTVECEFWHKKTFLCVPLAFRCFYFDFSLSFFMPVAPSSSPHLSLSPSFFLFRLILLTGIIILHQFTQRNAGRTSKSSAILYSVRRTLLRLLSQCCDAIHSLDYYYCFESTTRSPTWSSYFFVRVAMLSRCRMHFISRLTWWKLWKHHFILCSLRVFPFL